MSLAVAESEKKKVEKVVTQRSNRQLSSPVASCRCKNVGVFPGKFNFFVFPGKLNFGVFP